MTNEQTIYKLSPNVKFRSYLKGTIIEPSLALNETASAIFSKIDGQNSFSRIVELFTQEFEVAPADCQADIEAVLSDLTARGIVEVA